MIAEVTRPDSHHTSIPKNSNFSTCRAFYVHVGNFWSNGPADNPALTDALISEAQATLGLTLPDRYIELLKEKNGGNTAGWVFPTEQRTSWAIDFVALDSMFGIGAGNSDSNPGAVELAKQWGVPDLQVPLWGDGHCWITLDYRLGPDPKVTWIDAECDEEAPLAETFSAFVDGLISSEYIDPETGENLLPDAPRSPL